MELTENKKEKGIWKLPKNVRQIGEPGDGTRILIEDYAYTYLHQMAEQNLTCMKTAVLLGNAEDGRICIQAAVEADMGQDQKKWFTNEQWRDVFAEVQQWFSGLEVVGWFLSNPGFPVQLTEELRTLHEKHFPSDKHVLFLMDVMENDADFFIKFSTCKKYRRVTGRGMALWHVIVLLCKQHGQIRSSRGVLHRIADRLQYFFNLIQCYFFFFFCFNNNLQFQIIPKIGNSINARCDILPVKILSQLFYRRYRSKTDVFEYFTTDVFGCPCGVGFCGLPAFWLPLFFNTISSAFTYQSTSAPV